MPHSSGGGSHGGGSHGGSGFHSSGGSSGNTITTSRRYFTGCRTFVYYRGGRPHYIYSNMDIKNSKADRIIPLVVLGIFIFFISFAMIFMCTSKPTKLEGTEQYSIIIKDNANVLGDTTELKNELSEFKDLTGITPAIITVEHSDWSQYYNLENYAYDLYVNEFEDETHWLIVYSVPSGEDKFDWKWEAMQGDDTDDILTESKCNEYIEEIHKNLLIRSNTVSQAFANSFNEINKTVMVHVVEIAPLVFMGIFDAILIVVFIAVCFPGYKKSDLNEVNGKINDNGKPTEKNCDYCGGLYVVGLHTSCPHCGARVLAEDPISNQNSLDDDQFTIDSSKY